MSDDAYERALAEATALGAGVRMDVHAYRVDFVTDPTVATGTVSMNVLLKTLDRFLITETTPCTCGMRRFRVEDTHEGDVSFAHVGTLNPHNAAHRAVREMLRKEREEAR